MNNDHVAGALSRERQADYQREVEHDELVAAAQRGDADRDRGTGMDGAPVAQHLTSLGLGGAAEVVERVAAGRSSHLLVSGEAGVGKTRFAEAVADGRGP